MFDYFIATITPIIRRLNFICKFFARMTDFLFHLSYAAYGNWFSSGTCRRHEHEKLTPAAAKFIVRLRPSRYCNSIINSFFNHLLTPSYIFSDNVFLTVMAWLRSMNDTGKLSIISPYSMKKYCFPPPIYRRNFIFEIENQVYILSQAE